MKVGGDHVGCTPRPRLRRINAVGVGKWFKTVNTVAATLEFPSVSVRICLLTAVLERTDNKATCIYGTLSKESCAY